MFSLLDKSIYSLGFILSSVGGEGLIYTMALIWRSENNFQEVALSLAFQRLNQLGHLASPQLVLGVRTALLSVPFVLLLKTLEASCFQLERSLMFMHYSIT